MYLLNSWAGYSPVTSSSWYTCLHNSNELNNGLFYHFNTTHLLNSETSSVIFVMREYRIYQSEFSWQWSVTVSLFTNNTFVALIVENCGSRFGLVAQSITSFTLHLYRVIVRNASSSRIKYGASRGALDSEFTGSFQILMCQRRRTCS